MLDSHWFKLVESDTHWSNYCFILIVFIADSVTNVLKRKIIYEHFPL